MESKLQNNAILTGSTNSYCLVCEIYFDTVEDISLTSDHLQEETHSDQLAAHPYLEKYGDNHIRKVNKGYFCEFCSVLLATAARVSLHVLEKSHYEKKGTFLLRRPSGLSAVIAFEDILIGERAWHSLADETCALCNEDFSDENNHKTESGHLLKLVQNRVQFGPENNVYRTTDDSSFQCLTCNSVFALNTLDEHFNNREHKQLYAKCQHELKKYLEQNQSHDTKSSQEAKKPVDKNHNDITENSNTKEEAKKNEKDANNVKQELKTNEKDANNVKQEVETNEKDANNVKQEVETYGEEVKKQDQTNDCTDIVLRTSTPVEDLTSEPDLCGVLSVENDASEYANRNNLTYIEGKTNSFCGTCKTELPATLRSMKDHVNGKKHQRRMAKSSMLVDHAVVQANQTAKAKHTITKRPLKDIIDYVVKFRNGSIEDDVLINAMYCLPLSSYVLLTKNGARFRCQMCEVNVFEADITTHAATPRHKRAMDDMPFITSLPNSEFVREVRPNTYHCGFCNLIVPCWEEVASHLQSREHQETKKNKFESALRLRGLVQEHRRNMHIEFNMLRMHYLHKLLMFIRSYINN